MNLSGRATGDRVLHFRPDWMYGSHPSGEMPAGHLKKKRRKKKKKGDVTSSTRWEEFWETSVTVDIFITSNDLAGTRKLISRRTG